MGGFFIYKLMKYLKSFEDINYNIHIGDYVVYNKGRYIIIVNKLFKVLKTRWQPELKLSLSDYGPYYKEQILVKNLRFSSPHYWYDINNFRKATEEEIKEYELELATNKYNL